MMGLSEPVRTATADAFKKVDEELYNLGVRIYIDQDNDSILQVVKLGERAEPLTPLIVALASAEAPKASRKDPIAENLVISCTPAMTAAAPADPIVNQRIINMLTNPNPDLRNAALQALPQLENRKIGLKATATLMLNAREVRITLFWRLTSFRSAWMKTSSQPC